MTTKPPAFATGAVLAEIRDERRRQDARWGQQNHPDGTGPDGSLAGVPFGRLRDRVRTDVDGWARAGAATWSLILAEEVFEALAESDPAALRRELVQVAAVAAAWVEAIDRRSA